MPTPKLPAARLFLALWPPPAVRAALHEWQQQWRWPEGARVVDPQRLHVTLHFLGQVPLARLDEFRRSLAVPFEPHVLTLSQGRATTWPAGIAVLELAAPPGLLRLHRSLADVLRSIDWPVEARPFRPHVTFARHARAAQPPREMRAALPAWTVDHGYVLARSVPAHGYEVLQTYA